MSVTLSVREQEAILDRVYAHYLAIQRGRKVVESRSRNRCKDCGEHIEAENYDVNVERGFTERDIVWCRQCFSWVATHKGAIRKR